MTQHFPLNDGDPVHEGFFDPIQELLGASAPSLRLKVASTTTVTASGGSGNDQASVAVDGVYRYNTSDVTASLPASGDYTGSVYVTASANDFSGTPDPDSPTVYTFGLEIKQSGTPSTAKYRKVGEVDVVSGAIVALRQSYGASPRGDGPLFAVADHATQAALTVRGAASQSADMLRVQDSSATNFVTVSSAGDTTLAGSLTVSDSDGVVISGSGGNDTLSLSSTTSGTGITIGGDVNLYRHAANTLRTDDLLTVSRAASTDAAVGLLVSGDTEYRLSSTAAGELKWSTGSASADLRLRRSASNTLTVDDGSGGAAKLAVTGNVGFNGASPAAAPDYTVTNGTTDRSYNANSTTLDELADVVSTVISDLISVGLFQ